MANNVQDDCGDIRARDDSPSSGVGPVGAARTGLWMTLCAISMVFAADVSALIVRQGTDDGTWLRLPKAYGVCTAALSAGAICAAMARRAGNRPKTKGKGVYGAWLAGAAISGLVFLVANFIGWWQLAERGVHLAANSNGAFFYVFTATFAICVAAGIAAILAIRGRGDVRNGNRADLVGNAAIYWEFLAGLWVCLLIVFGVRF